MLKSRSDTAKTLTSVAWTAQYTELLLEVFLPLDAARYMPLDKSVRLFVTVGYSVEKNEIYHQDTIILV